MNSIGNFWSYGAVLTLSGLSKSNYWSGSSLEGISTGCLLDSNLTVLSITGVDILGLWWRLKDYFKMDPLFVVRGVNLWSEDCCLLSLLSNMLPEISWYSKILFPSLDIAGSYWTERFRFDKLSRWSWSDKAHTALRALMVIFRREILPMLVPKLSWIF